MDRMEMLVRTIIYLQKISTELENNETNKEVLKRAIGIIEKIVLEEE